MQNKPTISYQIGDYYQIKDQNLKAQKYIGKICSIKSIESNEAILIKYIFPEDTKEGRKDYMSFYEILLTDEKILYKFSKNKVKETKVAVTDISDFIRRKYIKKEDQSITQIYFLRQKYSKNGELLPELPKICYCQKIFNPDYQFKTCNCGCYFHPICFMKSKTNKCWNEKCSVDCSIFFSKEEMLDKKKEMNNLFKVQIKNTSISKSTIIPPPEKRSVVMSEDFFISENVQNTINNNGNCGDKVECKFDTAELFQKSKKKNNIKNDTIEVTLTRTNNAKETKKKEKKIKQEPFIELGIKSEKKFNSPLKKVKSPIKSPNKKMFDITIYEKKSGGYQSQVKIERILERNSIEENKKKMETERDRARKIIYDNMINGVNYLQKHSEILERFEKEKERPIKQEYLSLIKNNNSYLIKNKYKEFANLIESNLFKNCEEKTGSAYYSFLQEFALLIKNSKNLLFRIILGELTPEEISKFKVDDFLPEEKRKEIEELKNKEIQKIKFNGPMTIMAISNKGRMLTEIQDNIEVNKINYVMDTHLNQDDKLNFSKFSQKMKKMKEKYPNMNENDAKFLIEAMEPDEEEIQKKISSMIHETLNLEEQKEFLSFRKNKLRRKAEKYYKKVNDGTDKQLLGKKIQDYMDIISLGIKSY